MGLEGFKRYQDLCKMQFFPSRIGFGPKVTDPEEDSRVKGGDINRFNARVRLAKDFQSMTLDGYSEEAALGYNGYLQLFLTHSALERFMEIYGIRHVSGLSDLLESHGSKEAIEGFFGFDRGGKLYDFLCERIDKRGKRIEDGLTECKLGKSANVAFVSAAVRHIFAHGHLTANANGINPKNVNKACMLVSDFLLRFMDAEFTRKIDACYDRIAEKEASARLEVTPALAEERQRAVSEELVFCTRWSG